MNVDDDPRPFWLGDAAYWMPAHYPPVSAWFTHAPFAAWLMSVLRPRVVAELGTHYGFSCFVFAEAAKRLGLPATVYAVDTWQGDDHAGFYDEEVFEYVSRIRSSDYDDQVRLVRSLFHDARPDFADGSVDLLHIDGRHGYEDVLADYSEWRSAVRDGGVIVFHDITEHRAGFGVFQLWDEIAEPGRSFMFEHGHGLGILGVGDVAPGPLADLFAADDVTAARIRTDFERLGARVQRQSQLETMPRKLDEAHAEIRTRTAHEEELEQALVAAESQRATQQERIADLQNKLGERDAHIDALTSSTSWRVTAPLRAVGRLVPRRRT